MNQNNSNDKFYKKYLRYKIKYLKLKKQLGGEGDDNIPLEDLYPVSCKDTIWKKQFMK